MKSKAEKGPRKQATPAMLPLKHLRQMLLPMVAGISATKDHLMEWVHGVGLEALSAVLAESAESLAGPKGKRLPGRGANHWGTTRTELPFGGRRIVIDRPRVMAKGSRTGRRHEIALPALEHFKALDPLPERVVNQILLGVTTRGYERSLEPRPKVVSRGASKSATSRQLIKRTRSSMEAQLGRRLDDVRLIGLYLDGIVVARQSVVVALGLAEDGSKIPLGLWHGSTENSTVCTALLQDLLKRGLAIEGRVLCVIDGGSGLRKALTDVLGDLALVQRCQVHKLRNLRDHLPKKSQAYVIGAMREAYKATSADTARKRLKTVVAWLESSGHDDAAGSLREGLEETLTVIKLGLPKALSRSLATTNPIENLMGSVRRVTRNVKRWRGGDMIKRWVALGVFSAQQRFRRIKGHRDMPTLIKALRPTSQQIVEEAVA
jgi:transposase-like protein